MKPVLGVIALIVILILVIGVGMMFEMEWWGILILYIVVMGALSSFGEWWDYESSDEARQLIIWVPYFVIGAGLSYLVLINEGKFEALITIFVIIILIQYYNRY